MPVIPVCVSFADAVPAGTERCHEAVSKLGQEYDIVVNIQGDEPLLEPEIIDQVVAALQATPDAVYRCMRLGSVASMHLRKHASAHVAAAVV
jgi:CMP-2-keto-3-deoxyoctulosonic acid synthetase